MMMIKDFNLMFLFSLFTFIFLIFYISSHSVPMIPFIYNAIVKYNDLYDDINKHKKLLKHTKITTMIVTHIL